MVIMRERTRGGTETDPALTKQRKETARGGEVPFVALERSAWERCVRHLGAEWPGLMSLFQSLAFSYTALCVTLCRLHKKWSGAMLCVCVSLSLRVVESFLALGFRLEL